MRRASGARNSKSQGLVAGAGGVSGGLHELESKVRRKLTAVARHISASFNHDDNDDLPAPQVRQGIVSINGQDVETMRCTGRKRN